MGTFIEHSLCTGNALNVLVALTKSFSFHDSSITISNIWLRKHRGVPNVIQLANAKPRLRQPRSRVHTQSVYYTTLLNLHSNTDLAHPKNIRLSKLTFLIVKLYHTPLLLQQKLLTSSYRQYISTYMLTKYNSVKIYVEIQIIV